MLNHNLAQDAMENVKYRFVSCLRPFRACLVALVVIVHSRVSIDICSYGKFLGSHELQQWRI